MQAYGHTGWQRLGYLGINPAATPAGDAAFDAAAKKLGLPNGPGVGLELRKYISMHTDTYTVGPMTAAQYLAYVGQ